MRETLRELIEERLLVKSGKFYELWQKSESYEGKVVLDKDNEYSVEWDPDERME